MRSLFLLSLAALAASAVSADHVLVLGKSPTPIWHETRSSATFSTAGLADLALNSLGLRTGKLSSRPSGEMPLQADIFTHSEAYALILLEDVSTASLDALNVAFSGANAFHELYPAQVSTVNVPVAVAQEFKVEYPSALYCAGNPALCASIEASTPSETTEIVQQVLAANSFLSAHDEQDVAFARQLAQVMQLTADVKGHGDGKALYVLGISSLQGDKQRAAQEAMIKTVMDFLANLMEKEQVVAAQVMTGSLPMAVQQVAALSRKLASGRKAKKVKKEESSEDDEEEKSGEDDEEEDEVELAAGSGSVWEDDDNSTSSRNSTARGAVSMSDIAEYQIVLWTSVLLGTVLLGAVLAMANMDTGRDSLLYAKFIADVNSRKTN